MKYKFRGLVKAPEGILTYKGGSFTYLSHAITEESKCGFGPDYCEKVYRYEDLATGVHWVRYVYDGSLVMKTLEDFKSEGPQPI